MARTKKRIAVKPRKSPQWEEVAELFINSPDQRVSFYPEDGEIYVTIEREGYRSLIVKRDGTWKLD